MLTWNKRKTDSGYTIDIFNGNKILTITFGGNLDLYWYLKSEEEKEVDTFEITKENYFLYSLFDILYNDIVNCNIFNVSSIEKVFVYSLEELQNLYKNKEELNKKLLSSEEYKKLYNTEYICWYSDDDSIEDANYVKIRKGDDKYILEFLSNKKASVLWLKNSIRFRNSGTKYPPFNILFMNMYNSLCSSEYDENQIHIEEYLYKKKKR